jgi:hypothetical protein
MEDLSNLKGFFMSYLTKVKKYSKGQTEILAMGKCGRKELDQFKKWS